MMANELRKRARQEAASLEPEPADWRKYRRWVEARHAAVDRLAALSDWDPRLCREAALHSADWEPAVSHLLLDAAQGGGDGLLTKITL